MSDQTFAIMGIPLVPGQPLPTRQEITEWINNYSNKYQVSLFLRATTAFMGLDITQKLSYFQVAGTSFYNLVNVALYNWGRYSLLSFGTMGRRTPRYTSEQ